MVKSCCVYLCHNKADQKAKAHNLKFFRFPQRKRKRVAWVRAINRENWIPNESSRVCSAHFVEGFHSDDPNDINYVPTIFSYKERDESVSQVARTQRATERENLKETIAKEKEVERIATAHRQFSLFAHDGYALKESTFSDDVNKVNSIVSGHCFTDDIEIPKLIPTTDSDAQTDPDPLLVQNKQLREENRTLRKELEKNTWGVHRIKDDDAATRFYTGLPTFAVFLWLYNYLSRRSSRMSYWRGEGRAHTDRVRMVESSLQLIDQLLAVCMRLRLGLYLQDLANRFKLSISSFSMIFTTWISLMHKELQFLNPFPSREHIDKTMPKAFKEKYPSTRIIIDCTEIFLQRSSSLINQNLTFSNYKHNNTLKFLVGITPSGVISFVSEAWGGRVSDRKLTEESGLLDLIEPNDGVMADKGFTISDLLAKKNCKLNIPPFRGNRDQFTTNEIFQTQEIAQLRIHVERAIGRVKNYHILEGTLPLSLAPLASKIFQVCCWLTNLDAPLVHYES